MRTKKKREDAPVLEPVGKRDVRLDAVAKIAARFKGWAPARQVLTPVRAVPTRFPLYDRATRVGGHPIERVSLIHGPSGEGKTYFLSGLLDSFVAADHFAALVDAEMTTPVEGWLDKPGVMGGRADSPYFTAKRPESYEQTVDAVRSLVNVVAAARDAKELDPQTSALVVVDSIRKLVPENLMEKIAKQGAAGAKGSIDGYGGRAAQYKAALNAQWLDELVPLLFHTHTALAIITRETEDPEADIWDRRKGEDYKIGGGKALIFDTSLRVRITAKDIYDKDLERVVGVRHSGRIYKTKVSATDSEFTRFAFHTSNGVSAPEGFWPARDVLELARHYGLVKGEGWLSWRSQRWQGEKRALKWFAEHPEALVELELQARSRFKDDDPGTSTGPSEADEKAPEDPLFQ